MSFGESLENKKRQHATHVTLCGRLLIGMAEAAVSAAPDAAVAPSATAVSAVAFASASAAACAQDVAVAAHAAAEAAAIAHELNASHWMNPLAKWVA